MKAILIPFLSLLIPFTPQSAFAQSEPELKLESVVIVSRHGVRAPTKATQLMQDVTPDAWPTWPVKLGWLTPRGGELIAYLDITNASVWWLTDCWRKRAARSLVRSRLLLMSTGVPVKQAKPSPPGWHLTVQ